jgi:hypothetical protein
MTSLLCAAFENPQTSLSFVQFQHDGRLSSHYTFTVREDLRVENVHVLTFTLRSLHLSHPVLDLPRDRRWRRGSPFASSSTSERSVLNCGSLKHWKREFEPASIAIFHINYQVTVEL